MRVSVAIPAYRAEATIGRTLDSVLAQTYPAHEIIVVDDGSPDNQVAVIRQRACERLILVQQPNGRTARARSDSQGGETFKNRAPLPKTRARRLAVPFTRLAGRRPDSVPTSVPLHRPSCLCVLRRTRLDPG